MLNAIQISFFYSKKNKLFVYRSNRPRVDPDQTQQIMKPEGQMRDTLTVFMIHGKTFSSLRLFFTYYSDTLPTLHHTSERGRFLRLNTTGLSSRKFANAAFKTVSRLLFRLLPFVPR